MKNGNLFSQKDTSSASLHQYDECDEYVQRVSRLSVSSEESYVCKKKNLGYNNGTGCSLSFEKNNPKLKCFT